MKITGMKQLFRSFATAIVLLVGIGLTSVPAAAFAAPASSPCYTTSCTGQDPYTYPYKPVCTDNRQTIVSAAAIWNNQSVATVWNHFSIDCKANWAEYQLTPYGLSHGCGFTLSISDYYGGGPSSSLHYSGPYVAWTNMIDGTPYTQANIYGSCTTSGIPQQLSADANQ